MGVDADMAAPCLLLGDLGENAWQPDKTSKAKQAFTTHNAHGDK